MQKQTDAGNTHEITKEPTDKGPSSCSKETDRQLRVLLRAVEYTQQLLKEGERIAYREVVQLREAYNSITDCCVGEHADKKVSWNHPTAVACNAIITFLEEKVARDSEARTHAETAQSWISLRQFVKIPMQRRLQTFIISVCLIFTGGFFCVCLIPFLFLSIYTATLFCLYVVYIFFIDKLEHPLQPKAWYTSLPLWKHYRNYFPVRLFIPQHVRDRFDTKRNYFFIYHPHGIHSFGAITNFAVDPKLFTSMLPGIKPHLQTLKIHFFVPFWREVIKLAGAGDASARCIRNTLRAGPGESVALVVGGAQEALFARPRTNDSLVIKRRGFVRIALEEGVPLVPVYGYGENNTYEVMKAADAPWFLRATNMVKEVTGFVVPLIKGRGYFNFNFGLIPFRTPIMVVVGPPLEVPHIPKPTEDDIKYWHQKYVDALQELYNEYKVVYDVGAKELQLIE